MTPTVEMITCGFNNIFYRTLIQAMLSDLCKIMISSLTHNCNNLYCIITIETYNNSILSIVLLVTYFILLI